MTELEKLLSFHEETCPQGHLVITICNLEDSNKSLSLIQQVMHAVLTLPKALWHEGRESEWATYLPEWFVMSMKKYSLEEIMLLPHQWHFESWVATMQDRAWEWCSSFIKPDSLTIALTVYEEPYNVEPLFFLIREVCGENADITYSDM